MSHSHYVMDFYFAEARRPGGFRREVLRVVAIDDAEAVAEGRRIDEWKKSSYYQIRSIVTSARSGDKLIYSSRQVAEAPDQALTNGPAAGSPI
jgi:hypothetical protein